MSGEQPSVPPRFKAGTVLEGRLSSALVLDAREETSLFILLLLPSGHRVITKFWQVEAWELAPAMTEGWRIEQLTAGRGDPAWSTVLPDIESIAAVLNDHNWHGDETGYRYRVFPPDNASDEEMSRIEDLGGLF
jgi:hypothetical protein